jgi:hypothetical protein
MTSSVCNVVGCNKKIKLLDEIIAVCRCGKTHCITHRLSERHNCNFDYKGITNKEDTIRRMKCVASKINNI